MQQPGSIASDTPPVLSAVWQGHAISMYPSMGEVRDHWEAVVGGRDVFLSGEYLQALEEAPPEGMQFFYVLVGSPRPYGVILLQLKHFNAAQSLRYVRSGEGGDSPAGVTGSIRAFVASHMDFYTLVCGNALVTGKHGFVFDETVPEDTQVRIVDYVVDRAKTHLSDDGKNVQLVFIKDFFKPLFSRMRSGAACLQYNEFTAQPNMILEIDQDWKSYHDYLAALSSKYRVRARRARKMRAGVDCKPLRLTDLESMRGQLYDYYRRIADEASFNLFILHPDYIPSVKAHLQDSFEVMGYFEGDTLIAFFSMMDNGPELEAHFLGYDGEVNRERQLYLNMLLDMVDAGIRKRKARIVFARTAMEIKSSVGAEAHTMYFYLQHNKGFQNRLLPWFYNLLNPNEAWVPRHPFREEESEYAES